MQNPFADRQRQISGFDGRQEAAWRKQAFFGMLPTDQRLDAEHIAGSQVHLGLVVQTELFLRQGVDQGM